MTGGTARPSPLIPAMPGGTAPRRVLVLGATGGTGRQVVEQALEKGHHVTALVRDLYTDKEAGKVELRRSGLDWTLVYAVTLTDGPRTVRAHKAAFSNIVRQWIARMP